MITTAFIYVWLVMAVSGQRWHDGNHGKLKWASGCEFKGYNIGQRAGGGELCGGYCLAVSRCTHFTWISGVCYLKTITGVGSPVNVTGAMCGFILPSKEDHSHHLTDTSVLKKERGRLIWQEEFITFDLKRWKHIVTGWRGGNSEFQYYTNCRENSYVKDGILHIKPTLTVDHFDERFLYNGQLDLNKEGCNFERNGGCLITAGDDIINPIQSARIVTQDSFSFTYGVIEIRAKMPKGDWLWPAIWMLPTNYTYGNWLRSGELDIVESRGNANFTCDGAPSGRQVAGTAVHWGPNPEKNQYASLDWKKVNEHRDFSSDFHVYRVEWLPSGFKFFIDCTKIGEINPPAGGFFELGKFTGDNIWPSTSKMAPFDQPFHFILNVAVGGSFFADRCTNKPFNKPWSSADRDPMRKFWEKRNEWLPTWNLHTDDSAMQVDYIRVYES